MIRILFVCYGNICRSTMALRRGEAEEPHGTGDYEQMYVK